MANNTDLRTHQGVHVISHCLLVLGGVEGFTPWPQKLFNSHRRRVGQSHTPWQSWPVTKVLSDRAGGLAMALLTSAVIMHACVMHES